MVSVRLQFVQLRGSSYRYRRRVPENVREVIGKESWTRTWRPGTDLATVEREAKRLAQLHDHLIEEAKVGQAESIAKRMIADRSQHWYLEHLEQSLEDYGQDWRQDPQTRRIVKAIEGGGTYEPEGMSLTAALDRDRQVYSADKDPRPFKYAVDSFVNLNGDLDVTHIERRHVSDWLAVQRREGLSDGTVKRRYGTLKALVGRALLDLGSDRRNPFDGFKVSEGDGTVKRVPFNKAMLDRIDDYIQSGRVGFEVVALIKIMRSTGATIGEAGGLLVDDVRLDHQTPHLLLKYNRLRRLKNPSRTRPVPLVDDAALDMITEAIERAQDGQIFPGFHLERGADLLSAKVCKAIRAAGVPKSPRLTAHSFRHTVSEALRVSGAPFHIQRRLLGHASRDESDTYGAPAGRLIELADTLRAALPHLGEVDDGVYSDTERMDYSSDVS